jgi:signal peptidase I
MMPAYRAEDAVLVARTRRCRPPRRGDVVVFALPTDIAGPPGYLVKRVVAVAGEPMPGGGTSEVVEPGRVFLQGDAAGSYDSRAFGTIAIDRVRGRVISRLSRVSAPAGGR